jgi:undecaprenyl-diphosphatase
VVQGLTEFLPISSSGHLVLFPHFLGWTDPGLAFDVALHLGTLSAVIVYFRRDLWRLAESLIRWDDPGRAMDRRQVLFLLLATIPAALAGLALEDTAETAFRSPALVAATLMIMGLALAIADRFSRSNQKMTDLTLGASLAIGVAQALALIPGVSRSGVTITMGRVLGLERPEAARFSFLLAVPIIAGAGVLKIKDIFASPDPTGVAVGFISAALSGLLAIWFLMRFVQRHSYLPFVIYRWALGIFVLLNLGRIQ